MSLECFLLLLEVFVASLVLLVQGSLALDVSSRHEQRFFFLFKAELCFSQLHAAVAVATFLELNFSSHVEVFLCDSFVVTAECSVLTADLAIVVRNARQLSFGVLEGDLLGTEVVAS